MTFPNKLIQWAVRNERKLGAALFGFGFLTDLLTYGLLPIELAIVAFTIFLVLAGASMLGAHMTSRWHDAQDPKKKAVSVLFPLVVLYALGNLFSGFVIFYAKNSVIGVSWPFIIILILLYAGCEYFRMYKHYLIFQTTLFFFALYAYAIFALPLITGTVGPWTFAGSTLAASLVFSLFLLILWAANHTRFRESARNTIAASAVVVAVVVVSYFSGLIPPIPLALKDSGVFHSLVRVPGGYQVTAEDAKPWFDITPTRVHTVPGETLYVYSAVAAPGNLTGTIVHRWEHHNGKTWVMQNKISFPISGGREGGYRGYSAKESLLPGRWRVSVETPGGQVVGRLHFTVESTSTMPALTEQVL